MNINLKWSRKGIDSMAEKIRRDGECAELPALICLDMIVMLQAEVKRLEVACGCMTEAEPLQILLKALESLINHDGVVNSRAIARKALHSVLPLDYPESV